MPYWINSFFKYKWLVSVCKIWEINRKMNIILLSGGSGKRLWPLSDEIRSKQFLKLFQNEDGREESMLQRVHRQILKKIPSANIVVATGKKQVSLIREQLGNSVKVCVEPERRDTFPAIVLATAFMHYELGIEDSESIIICPVDPYVDESYFESIRELDMLSHQGIAKILLLGIHPSYPSEKYGYIIPESNSYVSSVASFKEKPDTNTAKKYLDEHALWNAGVFACEIRYILDLARVQVQFSDYRDLYKKYTLLPKISFDYAVVENENSICVVRYYGQWKDIGTWNVLSETMINPVLGNVLLDEECEGVNVINELDIPILCAGCNNLVVSASNNGILVADKTSCENLKPSVEKIADNNRVVTHTWGSFRIVDVQEESLTALLHFNKNQMLSYHSHNYRNEIWTVVAGNGIAIIDDDKQELKVGDTVIIAAGCKHMIIVNDKLSLLETQIGKYIDVTDKIKYTMPEQYSCYERNI